MQSLDSKSFQLVGWGGIREKEKRSDPKASLCCLFGELFCLLLVVVVLCFTRFARLLVELIFHSG